jgi:hypothetical protein
MLSGHEFTVGTLSDAKPLSLMLSRGRHEETFLVGQVEGLTAAVFLSGDYKFGVVEGSSASHWSGLLIPNVRIEMDETSLFDPRSTDAKNGALVRAGTELAIYAWWERSFGRASKVTLETGLPPTSDLAAGFSKWQAIIGEGVEKRLLFKVDASQVVRRS